MTFILLAIAVIGMHRLRALDRQVEHRATWHICPAYVVQRKDSAMRLKPKKPECSFCGRSDVAKMLAGPVGVYICNECVFLCLDVLREQGADLPDAAKQALSAAAKSEEHEDLRRVAKHIAENLANASIPLREAFDLLRKAGLAGRASVECYWCNGRFREQEISEHVASCEKHPAVTALREMQAQAER